MAQASRARQSFPPSGATTALPTPFLAVARNPDQVPERQDWNGRWQVSGEHDGVKIFAVVESDGRVWTAWPDEGSPGVVKNAVKDN